MHGVKYLVVFSKPSDRILEDLARAAKVQERAGYYRPFRRLGRVKAPHQLRKLTSWLLWRS